MFQIKYDNIFLTLAPNQDCEIERNSPLFLSDNFFAEYSTPISLAYSDETAKAIGWYFFEPTIRVKKKFAVEVWNKGNYKCNAILALESAGMNSRNKGANTAGGYLLIGVSDFLQTIQTKKLTELKLGGDRSFNFTTYDAFDGSNGYWQHFRATWDGTYDYVFVPCRNDTWTGSADDPFSNGFMNAVTVTGGTPQTVLTPGQQVVPFVFVKFILQSIFNEAGWSVDFSGLNDTEWQKLLLWNVKPLNVCNQSYETDTDSGELRQISSPIGAIRIHLADYMPPGYTCAQFITALCTRFGWAPILSTTTRSARFVALKEMKGKPVKDWTKYSAAASSSQISVDKKIFAFKQDFEGNDNFPSSPDFSTITIGNAVEKFSDLPNPSSGAFDPIVIYVYEDNQYYHVVTNDDNTARLWEVFSDNIYDDEPADGVAATDTFETKCATLPVYKTLFRNSGDVDYYAYFPTCSQSRFEQFGIKVLLYHGMVTETKADGSNGPVTYPLASSTHIRHDGGADLTWSNVYRHKNTSGTDYGIIQYWWQNWLDIISNVEDAFKKRYYLPLSELISFDWDDIILDRNIPYLIKQLIEPLPYKGYVECTMQRIALVKIADTNTSNIPEQTVYLRLTLINVVTGQHFESTQDEHNASEWNDAKTADIIVSAYSDEAGTIPLNLSGFSFKTVTNSYRDGVLNDSGAQTWVMNGTTQQVNLFVFKILEADYKHHYYPEPEFPEIDQQTTYHLLNEITLAFDPSYTIIP